MNKHEIKLWREAYLLSISLNDSGEGAKIIATTAVLEFREAYQQLALREEEEPEVYEWLDEPPFTGYYYLEWSNKAYYCFKRKDSETNQDMWFFSENHVDVSSHFRLTCRVRLA